MVERGHRENPVMADVMGVAPYVNNAELIEAVRVLGYLRDGRRTIDLTYGKGSWWSLWRPARLVTNDADLRCGTYHDDFRDTRWRNDSFDAVCFDPPYKLNGTDQGEGERYGVHVPTRWQDRMALIFEGVLECARLVKPRGYVLVKCMDQVCSGRVRWQTMEVRDVALDQGLSLEDRLDMVSFRAQPEGRRQVHARRNASTLLIFQKGLR